MGNRKLPFGYQMRMGEIVRNEPEAKAVQDIFLQYSLGASLKEIAEQMSKTGPSYDEGKSWNKNMIARILENAKYTGADSYPRLVDIKLFEAAVEKPRPSSVCQSGRPRRKPSSASALKRLHRRSNSRSHICSASWQSSRSASCSQNKHPSRRIRIRKLSWMTF